MELNIDKEFWDDFVQESIEHIEEIEMKVLTLEKEPDNEDIIHTMFRAFHTIKGLSGFVEHTVIQEIAHKTETLMDLCRKGEVKVDKEIVDAILKSSDYIKHLCEDVSSVGDSAFLSNITSHNNHLDVMATEEPTKKKSKTKSKKTSKKDESIEEKQEQPSLPVVETTRLKSPSEEYMKVANSKIDHLVDMIGELIINQSLIEQYVSCNYPNDNQFITNMAGLSRTTRELQDLSMFLRMVSLKPTFQKVTRIARDTIQELGKNVDFTTSGDSTEIDRVVTDKLLDPLVHLIKNAISHGVEESEADRTKAGKSVMAKVELLAYNKRGNIYIEIKDDGRGIDTEVVYQKALEKGLIEPNRDYTDEEIREFILLPGFSTAKQVDNISGRGVGMDVVKTQVTKIGGRVDIKSEIGIGTTFTLKIPVNHAIMNGTVIELQGEHFIIPTGNVKEILQPKESQWISTQQKRTMLRVRENIVPIVPISLLFRDIKEKSLNPLVLLLESEQDFRALPIDNVLNRQEVVVKPLGEEFANLKYISGMSILGNGKVSLILDIDYLFTMEVKE